MKVYHPDNYSYVTIVEIPKTEIKKLDFAICDQPRQTLLSYYNDCETKPDILINGGLFNMSNGNTLYNFVDEGVAYGKNAAYKWGMGLVDGELTYGCLDTKVYTDFISGYPPLIEDYGISKITYATELNYKARRSILAYTDTAVYVIAVESPGMTFGQVQEMLKSMKIRFAINLDGGGSTKILKNGKTITQDSFNRAVDNVFAVYLNPAIIYRVQLGAFSVKENAEKFCNIIKGLSGFDNFDYSKAYVKQVGNLYKVQVGAFSQKANAQKVVNDLKSKGYNAFITT